MENNIKEQSNFIQLKKDSILRIGIKDSDGNDTGEHLEFDMESVDLPLKLNQCEAQHRRNISDLKMQMTILKKKQDKKGEYLLSWKQEQEMKLIKNFYLKEIDALDLFLGNGGTRKLLNGREPYYSMYDDISEIIKPILPLLKLRTDDIISKIKNKYNDKNDGKVLE